MARAYSGAARPRLVQAVDGLNEVWAVGDILMVVPVVPNDCSADLEYALRLRRDALLTGKCEKCDAVPKLIAADKISDPPAVTAQFTHRITCPARDETVAPRLAEYRRSKRMKSFEESFGDAQQATRDSIKTLKSQATPIQSEEGETLGVALLERLIGDTPSTCSHLRIEPLQTWYTLIADGAWKCAECWAYFGRDIQEGFTLGFVEEQTCDLCRRYSPSGLNPLVIRIDIHVMTGGACRRCFSKYGSPSDTERPDE